MNTPPFVLSQADSRPMYSQIMDGIKHAVVTGQWSSGQALPSIREMAVALKVSVITVKRAYQELEREGVIITRQGMGSFIAEQHLAGAQKEEEMLELLRQAVSIARLLNLKPAAVQKQLSALFSELHDD